MNYKLVETDKDVKDIEMMAYVIWPITYKDIIQPSQIKYMLNKYLSTESIKENIKDGYTYILLFDEKNQNKIGFAGYKLDKDNILLSKLYLLPGFQQKGYASQVIEYLKSYNLPIELRVNKKNTNAYEAYLHLGFKMIRPIVTDIGDGYIMDDYILRLPAKN